MDKIDIAIPYFQEIVGHTPYRWQSRLFGELVKGKIPKSVDIPTGLGKTLCILLFLLARVQNPELPRRVVYVVDRRAIVDQSADQISSWIKNIANIPTLVNSFNDISAFTSDRPVQIGVLRGGLADDGDWRIDPARPCVVVGTVDMIGSRIMFSGYGDGRSRRPMHAGLLGHDCVVMLDEAHLSPAMAELIHTINQIQNHPKFQSVTLTATNTESESVFQLLPDEEADPRVYKRLHAIKRTKFHQVENVKRISKVCELATKHQTGAIAVFTQKVEDAQRIFQNLVKMLDSGGTERVALLTGRLRGKERSELASGIVWQRFFPFRERDKEFPAVFLVMTSAGEVGVDLDADHAVMDLAPLDSMIQRFGRINRTGCTQATVDILYPKKKEKEAQSKKSKTYLQRLEDARTNTLEILKKQPEMSPVTFRDFDRQTVEKCFAPSANPARLHAEVVEVFAATSAKLPLPQVSIYLRGVSDERDPPYSFLLWRRDTEHLVSLGNDVAKQVVDFFRPSADEVARMPTKDVHKLIEKMLQRSSLEGKLSLIVVYPNGDVKAISLKNKEEIPQLNHATLILPTKAGGLDSYGQPSIKAMKEVSDVGDNDDRVRFKAGDDIEDKLPDWLDQAVELRIQLGNSIDDDVEELKENYLVYALRRFDPTLQSNDNDLTWIGTKEQTIDEHCALVGEAARKIGEALGLSNYEISALGIAGSWHDRGKARSKWQRAAGIHTSGPPLAKSNKMQIRQEILGGYRHEFGSLVDAEREISMQTPGRELALHLIASHHGWARPGFPYSRQWDPDSPSVLNKRLAYEVADRFARLQSKHGPWRLAWLEALLKAADAYVSSHTN